MSSAWDRTCLVGESYPMAFPFLLLLLLKAESRGWEGRDRDLVPG